jgi:glyoxalase family protein
MKLDGIHHISSITGNAPANLNFYTRVLGMRLVAKTVNQDDPDVYHLFYGDYEGSPGFDMTFFEYPGARRGQAGAGMVYRIAFRVPSANSIDWWENRLRREDVPASVVDGELRFADPEGLELALVVDTTGEEPLHLRHSEIPDEHDLVGFDHVIAYGNRLTGSARVLTEVMGAEPTGERTWRLSGPSRSGWIRFDEPPPGHGLSGAGTVHHVAWATEPEEHDAWIDRLAKGGVSSTPVIDRHYFRSIYFREPGGVLYELATKGPGFTVDDPLDRLGRRLILPPRFEPMREKIAARLTPLPDVARS